MLLDFQDDQSISSTGTGGKVSVSGLQLPNSFCSNTTIYLHSFAVTGNETINYSSYPLSQFLIPIDDRDNKHYLLDAQFQDGTVDLNVYPFASIPAKVEAGVILETREMDMSKLIQRGFGRYVDRRAQVIKFPLNINPYVTPRDEYDSLIKCDPISLEIAYKPIGMSYWMLSETLIRSFDAAEDSMKINEYDIDSFKMLITGSSSLKLFVVYMVSILHFIFEYLALKSDFSFWKSKTTFDGISESSISMNVGMGVISALYVIEQDESRIALYFILIKLGMNLWKIYKLRKVTPGNSAMNELHQEEKRCMRLLMLSLVPLVVFFCAYRLVFYKFRSWYSWAILSLTAASEVFGFVTMTPQVFMNYRLKSVEHLPWSALTYSFINTFIDDLFAFGIFRVPEVSRYSCLRDDIVFVVICLQRWWYSKRREDEPAEKSEEMKKMD